MQPVTLTVDHMMFVYVRVRRNLRSARRVIQLTDGVCRKFPQKRLVAEPGVRCPGASLLRSCVSSTCADQGSLTQRPYSEYESVFEPRKECARELCHFWSGDPPCCLGSVRPTQGGGENRVEPVAAGRERESRPRDRRVGSLRLAAFAHWWGRWRDVSKPSLHRPRASPSASAPRPLGVRDILLPDLAGWLRTRLPAVRPRPRRPGSGPIPPCPR